MLALALNHLAAATRSGRSEADNALALYRESLAVAEEAQDRLLIAPVLMPVGRWRSSGAIWRKPSICCDRGWRFTSIFELTTSYPLALEQFFSTHSSTSVQLHICQKDERIHGSGTVTAAARRRSVPLRAWRRKAVWVVRRTRHQKVRHPSAPIIELGSVRPPTSRLRSGIGVGVC